MVRCSVAKCFNDAWKTVKTVHYMNKLNDNVSTLLSSKVWTMNNILYQSSIITKI